jgi:O-antigen/teichoic acid export membrane protein
LGFQVVIGSLSAVQTSLLARELNFRRLFRIKLATAFIPAGFSIPLAFWGYGVWALVAGYLASSLLNLGLLWWTSTWRPSWQFDAPLARRLSRFGIWIVGESLAVWFFGWGDNLFVGKFMGVDALGVYSVSWNICFMIFGLTLNPFLTVLYPAFSRLQDDLESMKSAFHKVNRIVISLALPLGTGLLLVGPLLASVLFGEKWQGLGLMLSLIGFMEGMTWVVWINPEVYRALGRPDVNTKVMFLTIIFYLPAYWVGAPYGLKVFAFVRLGLELLSIPIHIFFCMRMLGASPLYLWYDGKPMILATVVMALGVIGAKWLLNSLTGELSGILSLVALIGTGLMAYGGMLWVLDPPFVLQTRSLLKKAIFT